MAAQGATSPVTLAKHCAAVDPQTVGGFKKSFQEQDRTHEKALRTPNLTLLGGQYKMKPPATKGNKKRDKLGDKTEDKLGDKGRDKRRQDLRKAETPYNKGKQEGVQWETKGDKTLGKVDAPSEKGKQEEVQWETRGEKVSGRRTHY